MSKHEKTAIAASLASATCSLLGTPAATPVQAQEEPGWDLNTALLYYGENDDRVQDVSLNLQAIRSFIDDRLLTLGLAVDTLTGATPSGAIPFDGPQTFTRPSARSTYTVPANTIPLDDSFLDTRVAANASWQQPLGRLYSISAGVSASNEYDYTHMGVNAKLSRDFNKRNTTVSAGFAIAMDDISPVGGAPVPLSQMLGEDDRSNKTGDESKDVLDFVLGVTQVVSRNLLVQFNYSYSNATGYLNDPYKILSVVDGTTGDPVPLVSIPDDDRPSHLYRYENRPDERTKHSIYGQAKYYMGGKVLDLSYRYMTDDWEIDSHTVDARLRWPVSDSSYLEPHVRFYTQTAADFYRISLVDGDPLPSFASADYRLGEFDAVTVGMKYGWQLRSGHEMSVRLEYYMQDGDAPAGQVIGNQASQDLYPDLDAIIAQFSYRFGW